MHRKQIKITKQQLIGPTNDVNYALSSTALLADDLIKCYTFSFHILFTDTRILRTNKADG